jgi:hypothetical protein
VCILYSDIIPWNIHETIFVSKLSIQLTANQVPNRAWNNTRMCFDCACLNRIE